MRVEVRDDTLRENACIEVTDAVRAQYFEVHKTPLPDHVRFLPIKDKNRQVQYPVTQVHVYEGRRLELAILRAKRWFRSRTITSSPAWHIALAVLAFKEADPEGFKLALAETNQRLGF